MPKTRLLLSFLLLLATMMGRDAVAESRVPPAEEAAISVEALRSDFDALYQGLQDAHYDLYARRARTEYDAFFHALRESISRPLTPLQARIMFQRLVAYGNVAHARIDPPMADWEQFRSEGGKAFPLRLRVKGERVFLIHGSAPVEGIRAGDQLLSVDGMPAWTWLTRLRAHVSADTDYMAWAQLENLLPLAVWLEFGEQAQFEVRVATASGEQVDRRVPARSRADAVNNAAEDVAPAFTLDGSTRDARMLGQDVAYLRPGPFYDNRPEAPHPWDPSAFTAFIDAAFAEFAARDAKALIVDLRDNPGGDNSFSDPMLAWIASQPFRFTEAFEIKVSDSTVASNQRRLQAQGGGKDSVSAQLADAYAGQPAGSIVRFPVAFVSPRAAPRFEGKVFVLINRHTYSNAVLVAAMVQDYGFGAVLGEETSDLASTLGAAESFTLPRTQIEVHYPKARILRPNGDSQPRGVVPDVPIDTPIVADDDVVLQRAYAHAARSTEK